MKATFHQWLHCSCSYSGIFARRGPGPTARKQLWRFFFVFFSPQLILQFYRGCPANELLYFKVSEGVQLFQGGRGFQLFPGGSNFFQGGGGVQMLISRKISHLTCDFPRGGGPNPLSPNPPPMDPHMLFAKIKTILMSEKYNFIWKS